MTAIVRKLPLNVVRQKTRHGKIVFYYRVGQGKRIRLPDLTADDFMDAYRACVAGEPIKPRGKEDTRSIAWLVARYMESGAWKALSNGTRKQRGPIFAGIVAKNGSAPFSKLTRKAVENGMEDRRHTPEQANCYLKAVVGLGKWAVKDNHLPSNPGEGLSKFNIKSDGFPVWDADDVRQFCEYWKIGTKQRLALELTLYTGLRRQDVCRLGRQHMRGNTLSIKPTKTERSSNVRVTVDLPQRVLDIIAATPTGDMTFLVTEFKKPFTVAGFGNWFGDACEKAHVGKSLHGLRKLAATLAANGGATAHELMSQFGWTTVAQAEVYTRGADRVRLGKKSSRIVSEQLENVLIPHQNPGEGREEENADKTGT